MRKLLLINKATLLATPESELNETLATHWLSFYPKVIQSLSRVALELSYELILIDRSTAAEGAQESGKLLALTQALKQEGILFAETISAHDFGAENDGSQQLNKAINLMLGKQKIDWQHSYVIGNAPSDSQLAMLLPTNFIAVKHEPLEATAFQSASWVEVGAFLKALPRTANTQRNTSETQISIALNVDGSGKSDIQTGIGFFDHMLTQIAKHGNMDLHIAVKGDLHIDEHHTIEDVGIALGETFAQVVGNKKGLQRYGFLLPMDDCLAQVAVDFGGRPWLVWQAEFKREKVGDVPTEMFMHFFKSFCDSAKCNLNIKAEGENEHHKIESIFKAFAKAVSMALTRSNQFSIPSTKGVL